MFRNITASLPHPLAETPETPTTPVPEPTSVPFEPMDEADQGVEEEVGIFVVKLKLNVLKMCLTETEMSQNYAAFVNVSYSVESDIK